MQAYAQLSTEWNFLNTTIFYKQSDTFSVPQKFLMMSISLVCYSAGQKNAQWIQHRLAKVGRIPYFCSITEADVFKTKQKPRMPTAKKESYIPVNNPGTT